MKHALEYLGALLHLVGMLLFVGGHLWLGFLAALTERRQDGEGARFLARHLPRLANIFGVGVLLLFGSGMLRLLVWGEPGLIFLPDPYGWLLFSKLILYMLIVLNGALIERRYLPYVLQEHPAPTGVGTTLHLTSAWSQVKIRARLNLLLALIVVALGEALRYSRL
jgi:putative copper export protein